MRRWATCSRNASTPSSSARERRASDVSAHRVERPSARILLLDPAGRILLFRFAAPGQPGYWATPGGALDPGEDYGACARRELHEETGLDADCGEEVARRVVEFVTLPG